MNASELSRKLLFCGYSDLTDYLMNSPLNRYVYKTLLSELPERQIDVPILNLFNEIYYQCVHVRYDSNPGQDVYKRYLSEEERWLNSRQAAYLVFCFVWAFLSTRRSLSFHEECFVEQIKPIIEDGCYGILALKIKQEIVMFKMGVEEEIPTKSCPINEIPMRIDAESRNDSFFKRLLMGMMEEEGLLDSEFNPWKTLTNNFSRSVIEQYIWLYEKREDQMQLLKRIENACPKKDLKKHYEEFEEIKDKIKFGEYEKARFYDYDPEDFEPEESDPDEEFELNLVKVYNEAIDAEEKIDAEEHAMEYRKECMTLRRCVEEQKKEIETLKQQLEQKSEPEATREEREAQLGANLTIAEMACHMKERFSKAAAEEFCTMYYQLAMKKGFLDEQTAKLIDGIVPAIIHRDAPHQSFDIHDPHQVNINSDVENKYKEE